MSFREYFIALPPKTQGWLLIGLGVLTFPLPVVPTLLLAAGAKLVATCRSTSDSSRFKSESNSISEKGSEYRL